MKTLIELYDERPLENVMSTEIFKPERTVYLCQNDIDPKAKKALADYYAHRGIKTSLEFVTADMYSARDVYNSLKNAVERHGDCALDVSGGTDNALFAAGQLSSEKGLPVFTYSRRQNRYYNIANAPYAHKLDCPINYNVEDFFLMAGGSMREGRVDNAVLDRYLDYIDPFFAVYLRHRSDWGSFVNYIQRVSPVPKGEPVRLEIEGDYSVKGEHGRRISANEELLGEIEKIGFIEDLRIERGQSVSFRFMDSLVRTSLKTPVSRQSLYTYSSSTLPTSRSQVRT